MQSTRGMRSNKKETLLRFFFDWKLYDLDPEKPHKGGGLDGV